MRFNRWPQHIQLIHITMISNCIVLNYFHRFKFFQSGFLRDFIFSLIGIIFEMAHISNVSDVTNFIIQML